jgi:hypothetical protein
MFYKFQTLINNLMENTVGMAMPGGTDVTLGQVSAQYGVGKVTPASEADMAIASLSKKKKKQKDKSGFPKTSMNKSVLYTTKRTLPRDNM